MKKSFSSITAILLIAHGLSAQQLLFDKTISEQNVPVSSRLKNEMRSHYINSRYVAQQDFFEQKDFFINITPGLILKSKFTKIHSYPTGSFSYEGVLEGAVTGHITFSKYNDRTAGLILLDDGRKYMIDQLASNIFAVSLSNESVFTQREQHPDFIEMTPSSKGGPPPASSICDAANVCPGSSNIDMMVVYTQLAEDNWGGASNTIANITTAVTNMNISMANSGINNVTFRLVHTTKVSYTESGNSNTDLSRLRGNNDGYIDDVHALRDQYGADIVSLIVGLTSNSLCGMGYLNSSPTSYSAGNAFNISMYSCVVGNLTLAHECGHNMGLRHDWFVDPSTTPCSHHHGYVNQAAIAQGTASPTSARWRTIMAYTDQCTSVGIGCPKINMWSNPNLTYNGDVAGSPIGTAQPSDEAYAFYRMACLVAAFRPEVCIGPLDVSTNGTPSGAATIDLNTDIKGTISPKNDVDHYKFTITNPGSITVSLTTLPANYDLALLNGNGTQIAVSQNSGTQNETISTSVAAGDYYAKVFPRGNANNATTCYTLRVQTGTASKMIVSGKIIPETSSDKIVLYPNSATNQITIQNNDHKMLGIVSIYDMSGKIIYKNFIGSSRSIIDLKNFSSGVYYLRSDQMEKAIKFVKQ